jgi:hypothetical protein
MDKKWISLAAVILSLLACVLSGAALLGRPRSAVNSPTRLDPGTTPAQDWSKRFVELQSQIDRLATAELESSELHTPREPLVAPKGAPSDLEKRLTSLEASVAALEKQAKERPGAGRANSGAREDLKKAQTIATDPRASEKDKLAALRSLRGSRLDDGQDAISHEVILAMIDMAEHSADESVRDAVFRDLHREADQSLRDSMLRALSSDPSALVRSRAATDIDTFLPDALVVNALQRAADSDPDSKVREEAAKTLHGH